MSFHRVLEPISVVVHLNLRSLSTHNHRHYGWGLERFVKSKTRKERQKIPPRYDMRVSSWKKLNQILMGKLFHYLGDEQTIKVASKKDTKQGTIKLKKPPPKHSKPGNWMDGSVVEGSYIAEDPSVFSTTSKAIC